MRTNYITTLTDNTRCRILNDTTTYMASHFFKTECGVITPNSDFKVVDEVRFKVNSSSFENGKMYVYEGSKAFSSMLFMIIDGDGMAYKMFFAEDINLVFLELHVKSLLKNNVFACNELEINKCKKGGLVVLDSSRGLLANKTDEEVLAFFEENGRVSEERLIKDGNKVEKMIIKETDYYYMFKNIVINKRFTNQYLSTYSSIALNDVSDKVSVSVTITDLEDVFVSSCGTVIYKGDKALKLNKKLETETYAFEGYRYKLNEGLIIEDDSREVLEKRCFDLITKGLRFKTIKDYFEDKIKANIFHLFSM